MAQFHTITVEKDLEEKNVFLAFVEDYNESMKMVAKLKKVAKEKGFKYSWKDYHNYCGDWVKSYAYENEDDFETIIISIDNDVHVQTRSDGFTYIYGLEKVERFANEKSAISFLKSLEINEWA